MKPDSFRASSTQWEWQIHRKRLSNSLTALAVLTDRHFFLLFLMPPFKGEYSRMETWAYPVSHKGREDCPRVPGCHLSLICWDFDPNNGFTWAVSSAPTQPAALRKEAEVLKGGVVCLITRQRASRIFRCTEFYVQTILYFQSFDPSKGIVKMLSSPSNIHFQNYWSERVY